jgi:hypothetical protein
MFPKLVGLTLMLVCLAAGLLAFRQHRLELAHQNADLFSQIVSTRQSLWDTQARSATLLQPQRLQQRIDKAQLAMVPVEPPVVAHPEQGFARRDTGDSRLPFNP